MTTPIIHQFDHLKKRLEELQSTKSAYVPLDLERALLAVDDVGHLPHAFLYSETEEGVNYWLRIARHGHTEESKQKLRDYIREYERRNHGG